MSEEAGAARERRPAVEVEIDGRRVRLSSLDRPLWRDPPFSKRDLVDYYTAVAPALLRHVAGRPVTLARFPEGVDRYGWYQTDCRPRPDWLPVCRVGTQDYCVLNDVASLLWAANVGTIELHPLLARVERVDAPTAVVLDLDPGTGAGLLACARVALELRAALADIGLVSFAKSSGSLGLHVHVPLNEPHAFAETKAFARSLARLLATRHRDSVVDVPARAQRRGKVLVDWGQNAATRSTVAPYSLRAMARPTVATPLAWEEVEAGVVEERADLLVFAPEDVRERLERHGDLFAPMADLAQRLPHAAG